MTRQTSSNSSGRSKGSGSSKSSSHVSSSTNAAHIDAVIRALATRQHGVVARDQLVRAGVPAHKIEYRLKTGRLQRLYRAVYRVGPVAGAREREMAAVLACGETAVLSHDSAAAAWALAPAQGDGATVHVSVQGSWRAPGRGVRVHRVGPLAADEVTRLDGIPITTPARTLLDLAACAGGAALERALARADREGIVDRESIERLLARHPRRPGTRRLAALLAGGARPALTRSEAEARFLALIRKARLREPEANVVVRGYEVDLLWRAERLIVEIDGYAFHSSRAAFEADRRRDSVLAVSGFRVVRVTWSQLSKEPEALLARIAQALVTPGT
ncbi:MAG TPA: type IV toxin-antitoxin system AbiEi family antitoxin domain-containing protein [Longimicrobiales bacterium]